ncbi:MAG: tetratricopeptide repeat protein [Gemmatimonadales bacterium]
MTAPRGARCTWSRPALGLALAAAVAATPLGAQRIKLPANLSELEQRASRDSNDAAAHYNVALAYWDAKRWDDADSALRLAVRLDPQFAVAYMALAGLPYAGRSQLFEEQYERRVPAEWQPRVEESERMYRRSTLIDPLVDVRLSYVIVPDAGKLHTSLAILFGDWVGDYVDGVNYYFEGRYEDAYQRMQRVYNELDADRHGQRLWNTLLFWHGLAAAHTQRHDEAVSDFRTIVDRFESHEAAARDTTLRVPLNTNDYRYILAVLTQRAGRLDDAVRLYQRTLEEDLGFYMAHVRLAEIHEAAGRWNAATDARRNAVNASPDNASLLLDLGITLAKAQRWGEAETPLRQAMEANPRDSRVPYYLGIVQQQLGKTADARASFDQFLSLAPSRYERQIANAKQRLAALQ